MRREARTRKTARSHVHICARLNIRVPPRYNHRSVFGGNINKILLTSEYVWMCVCVCVSLFVNRLCERAMPLPLPRPRGHLMFMCWLWAFRVGINWTHAATKLFRVQCSLCLVCKYRYHCQCASVLNFEEHQITTRLKHRCKSISSILHETRLWPIREDAVSADEPTAHQWSRVKGYIKVLLHRDRHWAAQKLSKN